jgi:N utilization substance protein B
MQQHRARRLALQTLCCLDVQGEKVLDLLDEFISDSSESLETVVAARELLRAAWEGKVQSDKLLARHAHRWDLHRLALVDRGILRLAVHELRSGLPPRIVIDEAIKLAQEFSSGESPRFINGVLDAVARELSGQPRQEPKG